MLKQLRPESVDLVLTDPPYNIGVKTQKGKKNVTNNWDIIENYTEWCIQWLKECERVLKPNGVLYFWHNDIGKIVELMEEIKRKTNFILISFCIWNKGEAYRAKAWRERDPEGKNALRSWFNVCEYCLHFFYVPKKEK